MSEVETEVVEQAKADPLAEALVELVAAFHRVNCRGATWETCRNPECVKVQAVLKK